VNLNQANFGEARYSRCSQCQPESLARRSDSGPAYPALCSRGTPEELEDR
jgi:hypothetical protein